jgi:hypothetical protein
VVALGGTRDKAPFLPGAQADPTHQSSDAVFAVMAALALQTSADARAAVSGAAGVEGLLDLLLQDAVLLRAATLAFVLV